MATGNAPMDIMLDVETVLLATHYTSTACIHKMHDQCRLTCKFCEEECNCKCHEEKTSDGPAGKP